MNYIENLKKLIVENEVGQIDTFIKYILHPEMNTEKSDQRNDTIEQRQKELGNLPPIYNPIGVTSLVQKKTSAGLVTSETNSDPLYEGNLIDRLNTPFDHIERIFLQDFSPILLSEDHNYFRELFTIIFNSDSSNPEQRKHYGVSSITANDVDYIDYTPINSRFEKGDFFIDSFTYTPFIDFSNTQYNGVGDNRVGVYSDEYLTKYNTEWYDNIPERTDFVDINRRKLSSNLYLLRNLDKDIFDAKTSFRKAIELQDEKTYIYTFCEHLFTLFAKLSNIRMSHEFYGLKTPHTQWEGMLALDIWYNLLFKTIDMKYPFNDDNIDRNPMSKLEIQKDGSGREYVTYFDQTIYVDEIVDNSSMTVFKDSPGTEPGYVLLWDNNLWNEYDSTSKDIRDKRRDYVSPRGVLKILNTIINTNLHTSDVTSFAYGITNKTDDYDWFNQGSSKIYSDSSKSNYTKYTNLHLGRAYDILTPKEYHEIVGVAYSIDNHVAHYIKPAIMDADSNVMTIMLERGVNALEDAFAVIKNEKLFNIFNSSINSVEEFNPSHILNYSESQCAIVIERIFSRLYKYLSFKSTTHEIFPKHINIDSGYKYLTSDSILNSDNPNSGCYFDDSIQDDTPQYLSYISKIKQDYLTDKSPRRNVINSTERNVILNAIDNVLTFLPRNWMEKKWDLCPYCLGEEKRSEVVQSVSRSMSLKSNRAGSEPSNIKTITIDFNLQNFMQLDYSKNPNIKDVTLSTIDGRPISAEYSTQADDFTLPLSLFTLHPWYVNDGIVVDYEILGYSLSPNATQPEFSVGYTITNGDLVDHDYNLTLYAVWKSNYILKFNKGIGELVGTMDRQVVPSGMNVSVDKCKFTDVRKGKKFTYYDNEYWVSVNDPSKNQEVNLYEFDHWEYQYNNLIVNVRDGATIMIPSGLSKMPPVITLTAKWRVRWDRVTFKVDGRKYCDVLIDNRTNRLEYPLPPAITIPGRKFLGWDRVSGDILGGIERVDMIVCCNIDESDGECVHNPTVCGSEGRPIICADTAILGYGLVVNAYLADLEQKEFGLTFKFIDEDSGYTTYRYEDVQENQKIPFFHLHDTIEVNGRTKKFRYWKVESGNVSSELTILSATVLVAIYDDITNPEQEILNEKLNDSVVLTPYVQIEPEYNGCPYLSKGTNSQGRRYCRFTGISPRAKKYKLDSNGKLTTQVETTFFDESLLNINCPLLNAFLRPITQPNDFNTLTRIEINDISAMLKGLVKINLDIAHREYFLKIDIQDDVDWWYGYNTSGTDFDQIICGGDSDNVICSEDSSDIICGSEKWISFEPSIEFKFSNFHASNQVVNGQLVCTCNTSNDSSLPQNLRVIPINRELLFDDGGVHYNDIFYYYDYQKSLTDVQITGETSLETIEDITKNDQQKYYNIQPLCLYENLAIQSPVDVNGFIKHRLSAILRTNKQVQTYTSIVKKYRPIIMPNVRDIFNDCINDYTKYEVDNDNQYGVFGWCSLPSKAMVNMEYNEHSIIVPSSYDHHNRIGGHNFLQMDSDFSNVYRVYDKNTGRIVSNIKDTWYYLYNSRDWTYFLEPFFNITPNIDVWSTMLDSYPKSEWPSTSNHINGVIFEQTTDGRSVDTTFGDIMRTCEYLASKHHNKNNLKILAEKYTKMLSYQKLKEMTGDFIDLNNNDEQDDNEPWRFNTIYGSRYDNIPEDFRYSDSDWVDDFDKTSSYVGYKENGVLKYPYNLGQRHAIDDYDEDSVWFYITMTSPLDEVESVELEDIMPFVFWWSNRGKQNNGPDVDCYGLPSSAKLNYVMGGWCYESSYPGTEDVYNDDKQPEQRWHAVQHTLGVDFSKNEYGGTILTQDNSGNCFKGAFDPDCSGSDEKWKIHHISNEFGTNQHEDPNEDKYYFALQTHGENNAPTTVNPDSLNDVIRESVQSKPMTWNLWNVVRHYAYIKYFKNKSRHISGTESEWKELEAQTRRIVKGIYRTYKQTMDSYSDEDITFGTTDGVATNYGEQCLVKWTNSFIEISAIFDRNAREHEASFVMFTGDNRTTSEEIENALIHDDRYASMTNSDKDEFRRTYDYRKIRYSRDNFLVTTLDGVDDDADGMRPRVWDEAQGKYVAQTNELLETMYDRSKLYQGFKYNDMPPTYVVGDNVVYNQRKPDISIQLGQAFNFDEKYPESEYTVENNPTSKWIRRITKQIMVKQLLPVYTSMETFRDSSGRLISHHDITIDQMKSITFQVVPQFYWRYQWSYNSFMIHRVGKLDSHSPELMLWDMLGNVWEWVRDDYLVDEHGNDVITGGENPIASDTTHRVKVIKGGAFDQLCRKTYSASREGLESDKNRSKFGTQANVGFRPSMVFTVEKEGYSSFAISDDPVDLFFLFDASASQNGQITEMIKSAEKIVEQFAGDSANKDKCHVGSALFLGPTIKFMCSKKHTSFSEAIQWMTSDITVITSVWTKKCKSKYEELWKHYYKNGVRCESQADCLIPGAVASASLSRKLFRDKFTNFKQNWDGTATVSSRDNDYTQFTEDFSFSDMMARDGGGSGGGGSGGGGGGGGTVDDDPHHWCVTEYGTNYMYWDRTINFHVHSGVPVWKSVETNDEGEYTKLHFGEVEGTGFSDRYNFFTYDPTGKGISTFKYPFIADEQGCLSNWWCGCEPSFDIVSKLLNDGFFWEFPWNVGLGYMFRPNTPKLVFVFSNEYDNELVRTSDGKSTVQHEELFVPTVTSANKLKFSFFKHNKIRNLKGDFKNGMDQNAPDPYCLQIFNNTELSDISDYLSNIGIDDDQVTQICGTFDNLQSTLKMDTIKKLIYTFNGNDDTTERIFKKNTGIYQDNKFIFCPVNPNVDTYQHEGGVEINTAIDTGFPGSNEVNMGTSDKLEWLSAKNVLSYQELQAITDSNTLSDLEISMEAGPLPGMYYSKRAKGKVFNLVGMTSDVPKTSGFYKLRDTFSFKMPHKVINTYWMVTDANSPVPIDEAEYYKDDEGNIIGYAKYPMFFLYNDNRFFSEFSDMEITCPDITSNLKNSSASIVKNNSDIWRGAVYSNLIYWANKSDIDIKSWNIGDQMDTIFDGLENPYKKTSIIYGQRYGVASFIGWINPKETYDCTYDYLLAVSPQALYSETGLGRYIKSNGTDFQKFDGVQPVDGFINYINEHINESGWMDTHLIKIRHNMPILNLSADTSELIGIKLQVLDGVDLDGNPITNDAGEPIKRVVCKEPANGFQFTKRGFIINKILSGESFVACSPDLSGRQTNSLFNTRIFSYVTIDYAGGGHLKLIDIQTTPIALNGHSIQLKDYKELAKQLFDKNGNSYPTEWLKACKHIASKHMKDILGKKFGTDANIDKVWGQMGKTFDRGSSDSDILKIPTSLEFMQDFYKSIKTVMPTLMAYRYYKDFLTFRNTLEKPVTDYNDEDNSVVVKPVPVMDVTNLCETFLTSFGGGQFNSTSTFGYSHCVIDLNPQVDGDEWEDNDWNKQGWSSTISGFPMKFVNLGNVNEDDTYKKSKIVLTRVKEISGEPKKVDGAFEKTVFNMGSHESDYQQVTDQLAIKYKDAEAIVDQSIENNVDVTLSNGGSYQKNDALFEIPADPALENNEKNRKYFRNKHFFIDPFQLTIAQWCYVNGKKTHAEASAFLASSSDLADLDEMAYSYWVYIMTWESAEWSEIKNTVDLCVGVSPYSDEDQDYVDWLSDPSRRDTYYNPLEDTRPYYYATYDKVRGIGDVYNNASGTHSNQYTFTTSSRIGLDEYQLNMKPDTTSFLDILNKNVKFYTWDRSDVEFGNGYITDADDGGRRLRIRVESKPDKNRKTWVSGENAGVNFDLPTEAQWEYCCRVGTTTAHPMGDFGTTFETEDKGLDLYAWYKYKVIGTAPEPERFAAWRISKMLFGITRDKEQVGNVYETNT